VAVVQYTFTQKQYTKQHSSFWKSSDLARLYELSLAFALLNKEKARKNLSQFSRIVPAGTMKTEYTEQNIHNNKNT